MSMPKISCFIILLSTLFFASSSWAGGSAVNGVATRAEAMQAFTAVADDPSAVYYNPAGLTQLKGDQLDNSLMFIHTVHIFTNAVNGVRTDSSTGSTGLSLFYTTDKVKPYVMGIGLYAPFARLSNFVVNPGTFGGAVYSKLLRLDFVPTIAMRLNPNLSIGGGIVFSRVTMKTDVLGFFESGIGYGVSGQIGVLYSIPKYHVKLGGNYRGPMKARVHGAGVLAGISGDFTSDAKFPGVLNLGVSWQPTPATTLALDWEYQMWSYVNSITRNYSNPVLNAFGTNILNPKNSSSIRVGFSHHVCQDEYLGGYSYVTHALPSQSISPAIIDMSAHLISVGMRHYYNKHFYINGSYEMGITKNRLSNNPVFPGQHRMKLHSFLFGFGYIMGNDKVKVQRKGK